ncbi:serine hydrolase [Paenibacillus sp. CN-4]|uniref:serine hydrolase n=1 Tax=Paenibacillus nanchangensis TaxID=3348343 RepID=UPI00397B61D0
MQKMWSKLSLSLRAVLIFPLLFTSASSAWAASAPPPPPTGSQPSGLSRLAGILNPILSSAEKDGIRTAVAVQDLSGSFGDGRLLLGSDASYMPASTIKLALAAALLKQVDAGQIALSDSITVEQGDVVGGTGSLQKESFPQKVTVERLARLMITQSDNTATNVLIDAVGLERVDALMDELNLSVMHLGRKMFAKAPTPEQDNYINAPDLLSLLDRIYSTDLLSAASRDRLIGWMKAQEVKTKFGAALAGKPIAHKTGENANVTHDAGYFLIPGKELAVVVLTEVTTTSDFDEAQAIGNPLVQRIAKAIYNFAMDTPSSASPEAWPLLAVRVDPLIDQAEAQGIRVSFAARKVSDPETSGTLLLGSAQPYAPASTIKLALAAALMKQVDAGRIALSDTVTVKPEDVVGGTGSLQKETFPQEVTVERLARLMITQSDNTATNVLIDAVGLDQVDALMRELNLQVMHLGRKMFASASTPAQDNYISAGDLVTLLDEIYQGSFLSDASRNQLIDWMKAQEVKTKFGAVLDGRPIAHKTGENANVTHDTGYFLVPGKEIALAVLTEVTTTGDFDTAQAAGNPVVQTVAKAVYDFIAYEPAYPDVRPEHWAAKSISDASAAWLFAAAPDGSFKPDAPLTAAELETLLERLSVLLPEGVPFAASSIPASKSSPPAQAATRSEAIGSLVALYEAMRGQVFENAPASVPFPAPASASPDLAGLPSDARTALLKARQIGLVRGYSDGSFRAASPVTRAEAATLAFNFAAALQK